MTPQEVIKLIADEGVQIIDLKFTDLPGTLQHVGVPPNEVTEDLFANGTGFDGSSIRGFQTIDESDMLIVPDPNTAVIDPVYNIKTLSLLCNIRDPLTGSDYSRDPRYVAQKAEAYLASSGIGDTSYWGPEAEFFIFDSARFDQDAHSAFYSVDSDEGIWNASNEYQLDGKTRSKGYRPRYKGGYFPVPPVDTLSDIRSEMVIEMQKFGMTIEKQHHEVATAGQGEIDIVYDTLTKTADNIMIYKYLVKNVAAKHGKTATFMPKPLFGDNGTGMHTHQSIWRDGENIFWGDGYAHMSDTMKYYIGGLLKHAPALLAFAAPTTNSYRRLVPGYEAPVNLAYSSRNRSACCRIPAYFDTPPSKRIEFRCPDPTANPYFAFSAMLLAGIDGIRNQIDPGDPLDVDLYDLSPEEAANVQQVPGSLEETLDALEDDHEFLLTGDVFTSDLIETWLDYKRTNEVDEIRLRPHPYEFFLYYDA
ncbi:MAG: type I glutamate--ammonia ligase [Dehalococcoidia bacterium]|nr:type I glutamate--ammonia ligase [Dehalococcoidia bacterium]MYA62819.1 type I glutamate--ammonia ligase [Dehalococcoidia bacterium]